jgi:hypothetical protein
MARTPRSPRRSGTKRATGAAKRATPRAGRARLTLSSADQRENDALFSRTRRLRGVPAPAPAPEVLLASRYPHPAAVPMYGYVEVETLDDGTVVEKVYQGGKLIRRTETTPIKDGKNEKIVIDYGPDGEPTTSSVTVFEYDDKGRIKNSVEREYDPNTQPPTEKGAKATVYTYDPVTGKLKRRAVTVADATGKPIKFIVFDEEKGTRTEYDIGEDGMPKKPGRTSKLF